MDTCNITSIRSDTYNPFLWILIIMSKYIKRDCYVAKEKTPNTTDQEIDANDDDDDTSR